MAHVANYTASQVGAMLSHYGREEDDGVTRSNENIRTEATGSNYVVGIGDEPKRDTRHWAGKVSKYIRKQIEKTNKVRAAKGTRKMDSRATVMCDIVFTLPKDWPEERDPMEYFQLCHLFVCARYGRECSLPGFVHMDETTPHMHCPIVPMVDGEIRKRDLITRVDLKSFHGDLQSFVDKELGFHVSVLLDDNQKAEKAKSRLSQDEMIALNADTDAEVRAEVEAELSVERQKLAEERQRLDLRASKVARGEEDNAREAKRLNRLSRALDERDREQDAREQEQNERDSRQDERERELNALEVKLDKLKGKLKGISDFVMGWVHWIKEADEKERAARLEEGAEKVAGVEKFLVTVSEEYLEDEQSEDERSL